MPLAQSITLQRSESYVRYRLAWDHTVPRGGGPVMPACCSPSTRAPRGAHGIQEGKTGTVTVIQRFGYRRSCCDLLHEQSLGSATFRVVQGRRNGAARRSLGRLRVMDCTKADSLSRVFLKTAHLETPPLIRPFKAANSQRLGN
jgi:hypothetical protein